MDAQSLSKALESTSSSNTEAFYKLKNIVGMPRA